MFITHNFQNVGLIKVFTKRANGSKDKTLSRSSEHSELGKFIFANNFCTFTRDSIFVLVKRGKMAGKQ